MMQSLAGRFLTTFSARIRVSIALSVAVFLAGAAGLAVADPAPPSTKLLEGNLISPGVASNYYGTDPNQLHTVGLITLASQEPEIDALAKSLLGGRDISNATQKNEFIQNVFDYVRNNINTEFRYGLSKGGRGALIDQSGTAFDQAELMIKLLRKGGVTTATYRVGEITLTPLQFGQWTGLVKGLNQSAQNFTVDAKQACRLLADGGIPAVINGQSPADCNFSGDLTTVTLGHIWVKIGTAAYDPALKAYYLKNGIDVPAAIGCGTEAASTCGTTVINAAATGSTTSTAYGSTYIQNYNAGAALTQIKTYSVALENYIKNHDRTAAATDIIGGKELNPQTSTLTVTYTGRLTWSGDIPDMYRTLYSANGAFFADEIAGRRVANAPMPLVDDTVIQQNVNYVPAPARVPANQITLCPGECSTVFVDHPYAANGGTYGDEQVTFKLVEDPTFEVGIYRGFDAVNGPSNTPESSSAYYASDYPEKEITGSYPITYVHSFGQSSLTALKNATDINNVAALYSDTSYLCKPKTSSDIAYGLCGNEAQATIAESINPYRTLLDRLVDGVAGTVSTRHHDLGLIYSSRVPQVSRITLEESLSVAAKTGVENDRQVGYNMQAVTLSEVEGVASPMSQGKQFSFASMFFQTNPVGSTTGCYDICAPVSPGVVTAKIFDIAPGNMETFIANQPDAVASPLSGTHINEARYAFGFTCSPGTAGCWRKAQLSNIAGLGYSTIIMEGGQSELFYKGTNERAYTIWEYMKGGVAVTDPLAVTLKTAEVVDAASKARKELSISNATGALTYQAQPDIVSGAGDFPNSLPFVRTFSGTYMERGKLLDVVSAPHNCGGGSCGMVSHASHIPLRSGADAQFHDRLGGGWDHNYDISLSYTHNPSKNFGGDFALDASGVIAQLRVMKDVAGATDMPSRLATVVATMNMGYSTDAIVKLGTGGDSFHMLPDNTLFSSQNPSASLSGTVYTGGHGDVINFQWGNASAVEYSYSTQSFTGGMVPGTVSNYVPTNWTFPNGVVVSFNYTTMAYTSLDQTPNCFYLIGWTCSPGFVPAGKRLDSVTNNLGRSLTFTNSGRTVTDENGRHADFVLGTCANNTFPGLSKSTCDSFTATDPNGNVTRYEYTAGADSPDPATITRNNYQLRRIYSPTNASTPFQTIVYDNLFRVASVIDRNGNTTKYFPGGINGAELWKPSEIVLPAGERSRTVFNEKNADIYSKSPLGRITTKTYNNAGWPLKTVMPEGNGNENSYDERGNVVRTRVFSKTCGAAAITCADDIVTSTSFMEGRATLSDPAVLTCANRPTCDQPKSTTDALGNVTDYSWNASTGLLTQVLAPSVLSANDSTASNVYVRPQTDLGYTTYNGIAFLTSKTEKIANAVSVTTNYTYNSGNHYVLSGVTQDPTGLNLTTSLTFNANGDMISVDGPRTDVSDITTYQWDGGRRIRAIIQPDPDGSGPLLRAALRYTYNNDDLITKSETGVTNATDIVATPGNLQVSTYTDTLYDEMGNKRQVTIRDSANTILSLNQVKYDADDRVSCSVIRMNLASTATDACVVGTNGNYGYDRITKNLYNGDGELLQVRQAYGTQSVRNYATYGYTLNGKKASETDANGNVSRIGYDKFDRVALLAYPSAAAPGHVSCSDEVALTGCTDYESYNYDAAGNRTYQRRRNGAIVNYMFDALNRETVKDLPEWPVGAGNAATSDVYTAYDLLGRVIYKRSLRSGTIYNTVSNAYDKMGRLTGTTDVKDRVLSYEYNQAGARTKIVYPKKSVGGTDADYTSFTVDGLNRVTAATYTSGVSTFNVYSQAFNSLGQRRKLLRGGILATVSGETPDGDGVSSSQCVTATLVTCYEYDKLGRLSKLSHDLDATAYDITWTIPDYSPAGQVAKWTASTSTYDYKELTAYQKNNAYNGLNQDTAIASLGATCATASSGYDCGGNLVGEGMGGRTFTYDAENRLLTASDPVTGKSLQLTYDPVGRPFMRTVTNLSDSTSVTDYLLFDGVSLVGEYTYGNTQRRRYVFGTGTDDPVAWFEGPTNVSAPNFLFANYQGSVIAYTNTAGTKQAIYKYGAWGEPRDQGNAVSWSGARFRYTGQMALGDVRLYYYKARVYDPEYGRFLQTDPIGSKDDLDLYAYVKGDPINATDPDGMQTVPQTVYAEPATMPSQKTSLEIANFIVAHPGESLELIGDAIQIVGTVTAQPEVVLGGRAVSGAGTGVKWLRGEKASTAVPVTARSTGRGLVPLAGRDPKRFFSQADKKARLDSNGGKCDNCKSDLKLNDADGHHDQRHADGGKTDDANLKVLCEPCHVKAHKT